MILTTFFPFGLLPNLPIPPALHLYSNVRNDQGRCKFYNEGHPTQSCGPTHTLFRKVTLRSEPVVAFLDANFVISAFADVPAFHFCAVVAPASANFLVVLQRVKCNSRKKVALKAIYASKSISLNTHTHIHLN